MTDYADWIELESVQVTAETHDVWRCPKCLVMHDDRQTQNCDNPSVFCQLCGGEFRAIR